jgi:hypothetical protein
MTLELDHLVVAAPRLDGGVQWVERQFGVKMSPGGQHVAMGSHNALLKIGPRSYLEVIAIDPSLPQPAHERWFGLDDVRESDAPRLVSWVARASGVESAGLPWPDDCRRRMTRGSMSWHITIPATSLWNPWQHCPLVIEWGDERHPVDALPDQDVRLLQLTLLDPAPGLLQTWLRLCEGGESDGITFEASGHRGLRADFATPRGAVSFESTF